MAWAASSNGPSIGSKADVGRRPAARHRIKHHVSLLGIEVQDVQQQITRDSAGVLMAEDVAETIEHPGVVRRHACRCDNDSGKALGRFHDDEALHVGTDWIGIQEDDVRLRRVQPKR